MCPDEALNYFVKIMIVIGEAIRVTQIKLNEETDQDTVNYYIELRKTILETI